MQGGRDQADPGARGVSGRRPSQRRPPRRAQPPDAPRRLGRGLSQPRQAELGGLSRGLRPRQGERRHRDARAPFHWPDRAHRMSSVPLLPALGGGPPGRRQGPPRRPAPGVRPRQRLLGDPGQRDHRAGQGERGDRQVRAGGRPAAGRNRRRPLPPTRGLRPSRGAPLRADQVHARAAQAPVRHQRVLPEELRGNAGGVRSLARGGADDGRDRRALRDGDRARQAAPAAVPHPGRRGAGHDAPPARRGGPSPPLRGATAGRGRGAARVRTRGDRRDGLRVLLPDRLGLRQVRQGERHRRRARPWLGGGLDRRLRARHHGPRPAGQRPPVRAVPEPGAQVDAGHRHRLLGPRAGPGDPLRPGEVRARVGCADHHLRQDGPARRHPRCRPRPRVRLRHGRPRSRS